ncbi:hypothetical protein X564_11455 [Pseudoalteromonas agarivorans]|nr:hypothetical protein X564_11455 [Pseudoalteromonas agarivorans]
MSAIDKLICCILRSKSPQYEKFSALQGPNIKALLYIKGSLLLIGYNAETKCF